MEVCKAGETLFFEQPRYEWELPTDTRDYCLSEWGEDVPTGNARLKLTLSVLYAGDTMAQALQTMRDKELTLARYRQGTVVIEEGFNNGKPTVITTWHATVVALTPQPLLSGDEAMGANAKLQVVFLLTDPEY